MMPEMEPHERAAWNATDRCIADLLGALRELADVSRSYIAHMDADDIAALDKARAAIARAAAHRATA